jgi:hypothetical protein
MVDIISKLENPSLHKDSIFVDAQCDNKRIWPDTSKNKSYQNINKNEHVLYIN